MHTDDSPHNVEGNRSLLTRAFGITQERLVTVRQCHGSDILVIDAPNDDFSHFSGIEADAIITNQPDVMIGVTVADCVPILLYDPINKVIACVHAGWQGTAARICAQTVEGMQRVFGSKPDRLLASINVGGSAAGDVPASIAAASQSFNADNAKFTGATSATDIAALTALINNPANWTLNDTTAFALTNNSLFGI
jgi:YfiH family protein